MNEWDPRIEWGVRSPAGRGVRIHHDGNFWIAESAGAVVSSRSLDVALIGAIRADDDVVAHKQITDHALWIRGIAASIEGSLPP
jgi:hypothetical protein